MPSADSAPLRYRTDTHLSAAVRQMPRQAHAPVHRAIHSHMHSPTTYLNTFQSLDLQPLLPHSILQLPLFFSSRIRTVYIFCFFMGSRLLPYGYSLLLNQMTSGIV